MSVRGRREEGGYVAIVVAALFATLIVPLTAIAVDTARWYVEIERVQNAADAAALAGVTFLPDDMANAKRTAIEVAGRNGYPVSARTSVEVLAGDTSSQLRVGVTSTVDNSFAAAMGLPTNEITRWAVADYTAPAPMGSPCNTFGNEPPSGLVGSTLATGTALPPPSARFANCSSQPQFWAAVEGPATDKVQGDRYLTTSCTASGTYGCTARTNDEYRPEGYFFAVHVEPEAVNTSIEMQVYDPAYVQTGVDCGSIYQGYLLAWMNDYTQADGNDRYDDSSNRYCSGDYNPGGASGPAVDTTFLMREQTDTGNPLRGAVISGCTQQFAGRSSTPSVELREWDKDRRRDSDRYAGYNPEISRVFHQWVSLCSFTPSRSGDYYLQVRTNVALGGEAVRSRNRSGNEFDSVAYRDNPAASAATGNDTSGVGLNSFALRAIPTTNALRTKVSVAGAGRMPILQNAASSTATFNLIRALPQAAGQYVAFNFYDAADGSTSSGGSVTVQAPSDATGSIRSSSGVPGCRGTLNDGTYAALSGCKVSVRSSTHNGQVQRITIPLPKDYNCDPSTLGGCWFSVKVSFANSDVTDFTTWDANIGGDPVRLIE